MDFISVKAKIYSEYIIAIFQQDQFSAKIVIKIVYCLYVKKPILLRVTGDETYNTLIYIY